MNKILKNVEILDYDHLYNLQICKNNKVENNVFTAYGGYPSCDLDETCISNFTFSGYDGEDEKSEQEIKKSNKKSKTKLSANVKYVIAVINYPINNPAIFKFDCSSVELTYGKLLYLYTYAYQLMYKLEDEDVGEPPKNIHGMLNRGVSEGRFGIWGHDICDLIYNGDSELTYTDDTVICEFRVDS